MIFNNLHNPRLIGDSVFTNLKLETKPTNSLILDTGILFKNDFGVCISERFDDKIYNNRLILERSHKPQEISSSLHILSDFSVKVNPQTYINIIDNYFELVSDEVYIEANTTIDGNMVVTGDLILGGKTKKIDVISENLRINDNNIILNNNLTDEDPRLASHIVDGEDTDYNAGISVNRGKEGIIDIIKWVESKNLDDDSALNDATVQTSVWTENGYILSDIITEYLVHRKDMVDRIGSKSFIGFNAQEIPIDDKDYNDKTFSIDEAPLSSQIQTIVNKLDSMSFSKKTEKVFGETKEGTEFIIQHNLDTVYIDVKTQIFRDNSWFYDILIMEVVDSNNIKIIITEKTKIRFMIMRIDGIELSEEMIEIQ